MLKTLILICAVGLPQPECTIETATAVVQGPDVDGLIVCGLHGQAYLAETAIASYLADGHYLKIRCTPSSLRARASSAPPPARPAPGQPTAERRSEP